MNSKFIHFLTQLGFSLEKFSENFSYYEYVKTIHNYENIIVPFFYLPTNTETNKELYKIHREVWNGNITQGFIAVNEQEVYIIDAKTKPKSDKNYFPTFDYGVNNLHIPDELKEKISKQAIDSGYFFDWFLKQRKKVQEVDADLLLNLIALKNKLIENDNFQGIHLLILRCLFIKYLEDRGIYPEGYLADILKTKSPKNLIIAFEEIKKINGDIFKFDTFLVSEIKPAYLAELYLFFTTDYRSKQGSLFPYLFNKISIQLISNVYEAFLSQSYKGNKGIFYTPAFFVRFILSHVLLNPKENKVLDPACGSGGFLVEAFKQIIKANGAENDYDKKVFLLKNRIFGIDIDPQALQLSTFSLYLTLLEGESATSIQDKIRNAHPILPSLIGENLREGNTLVDNQLFENETFDCVVGNPPWVQIEMNENDNDIASRKAIDTEKEYLSVSNYQASQAFLLTSVRWASEQTKLAFVVNNAIFLNDKEKAKLFRQEILKKYSISHFYELSGLNKILFKKREIGKIGDDKVEIGASEPCAVIVFENHEPKEKQIICYISPSLHRFSEYLQLIVFSQKDIHQLEQRYFEDDLLWKILVNGDWESYLFVKKLRYKYSNNYKISCNRGFEAKKNAQLLGVPDDKKCVWSEDFNSYYLKNNTRKFNTNQTLRRPINTELCLGNKILTAYRPIPSDEYKLRCIFTNEEIVFKNDVLCTKIKDSDNYLPFLAILNSSFAGFYIFNSSSQWNDTNKREVLRTDDIKLFPFPKIEAKAEKELTDLVIQIQEAYIKGHSTIHLAQTIDEKVFEIYQLLDFEKEIIREFYQIKVERKNHFANERDLQNYADVFRESYAFVLKKGFALNIKYDISPNIGAYMCMYIVPDTDFKVKIQRENISLFHAIKAYQLEKSDFSAILNEDKIKIYEENCFFIVKSNLFKDWTTRQAMRDAQEEIELIFRNLPSKNV